MYKYSDGGFRTFEFDTTVDFHESIFQTLIEIDQDRYSGAYSGFAYTAWVGPRPSDLDAGDPTCSEFWEKYEGKALYGGGHTPQEAYKSLTEKLKDSDFGIIDFENPERSSLKTVIIHSTENSRDTTKAFVFNSQDFQDWLSI